MKRISSIFNHILTGTQKIIKHQRPNNTHLTVLLSSRYSCFVVVVVVFTIYIYICLNSIWMTWTPPRASANHLWAWGLGEMTGGEKQHRNIQDCTLVPALSFMSSRFIIICKALVVFWTSLRQTLVSREHVTTGLTGKGPKLVVTHQLNITFEDLRLTV